MLLTNKINSSVLAKNALRSAPVRAQSVLVRSGGEGKPSEPKKLEDIPASERKFTDAEWDNAIKQASSQPQASTPKAVSVGEAFAFSGPLPEKANGRLAMLGFVAALGAELSTGESVVTQFSEATPAILATALAFTVASLVPLLKGASQSEAMGPFTPQAEMTNGRMAMIGMASLIGYEVFKGTALF